MIDFDSWVQHGMDSGWCGPPVCATHDGVPTSADEDDWDFDICVHLIRLYADSENRLAVEENHSPSVWRKLNYDRSAVRHNSRPL